MLYRFHITSTALIHGVEPLAVEEYFLLSCLSGKVQKWKEVLEEDPIAGMDLYPRCLVGWEESGGVLVEIINWCCCC